jgi:hypothetical protein
MFGTNKSLKVLEKQKSFHREWLKKDANDELRPTDLKYILEDLESDAPGAWPNIADSFGRLGTWYAVSGLIALADGSSAGWRDVHRAWLYKVMSLRIRITTFQRGKMLGRFQPVKSLELEAGPSALCLAYALMVGRKSEAEFFGEAVRMMTVDKKAVPDAYWQYHGLESFVLRLSRLFQHDASAIGPSLGCYQGIIDAWNHPRELAKAIHSVCEFHCQRIECKSVKFSAEFREPPFDLIPAEVLAVYSVRQALGMATPVVDHPLLKPPFAAPIGSPSELHDELLDKVEAKLYALHSGQRLTPS